MLTTPFLTLQDPNAKIKGSRDPLGAQPIWAAFARHVITNVTTQSRSVRGFTVLLLGRYYAEQLIIAGKAPREDALDIFLRMEQAAAYVRHAAHGAEGDIRGIERVKAFLAEHRGRPYIQTDRRGMILSDQKVYGLWGLYSVAARTSGLIADGAVGVTDVGREFVERNYLPHLEPVRRALTQLLVRGGRLDTRGKDSVFAALASVLPESFTAAEAEFYGHHLRDGLRVPTAAPGRQQRFRDLLEEHTTLEGPVTRAEVVALAWGARQADESLARRLERIASLEALLAPAATLFDYLLANGGRRPKEIAESLQTHWGPGVPNLDHAAFQDLLPEIGEKTPPGTAKAIANCHSGLRTGDYADAVRACLEWNEKIMSARNAGPWAKIAEDGRLDVRYRGIEQLLPDGDALGSLWRNTYFIDSLKSITLQLRKRR